MSKAPFFLTLLLICLGFAPQSEAQDEGGFTFRLLTFERVEGLREINLVESNEKKKSLSKSTPVTMHKNNFTGPYRSTTRQLRFFAPNSDSTQSPKPVGEINIPIGLGKRILLIATPKDKESYQFFAMADDLESFKLGETKLLNLTSMEIGASLNKKLYKLAAGTVKQVSPFKANAKKQSFPVEFYHRKNAKSSWEPLTSSMWYYEPDIRFFSFIYLDPKEKRLRIRSIRDLPEATEKN